MCILHCLRDRCIDFYALQFTLINTITLFLPLDYSCKRIVRWHVPTCQRKKKLKQLNLGSMESIN